MSNTEGYLSANQANWDERVSTHLKSAFYDVEGWLRRCPGPEPRELAVLGDVAGQQFLHLQCHFGLDTLAWARAGAVVTGLDFSPAAIAAAQDLAQRAGLSERSRFVCADVYKASEALAGRVFDIVYVNLGALCWLPSVDSWAAQVGALVDAGGRFYIHDGHPLAWAMAPDKPLIEHTYFEEDAPYVDESGQTYTDAESPLANRRSYEWNHGIGQIVQRAPPPRSSPRVVDRVRLDLLASLSLAGTKLRRQLDNSTRQTALSAQLQSFGDQARARSRLNKPLS